MEHPDSEVGNSPTPPPQNHLPGHDRPLTDAHRWIEAKAHRMIRVLIADDHAAIRAGLSLILDTAKDITIIGEASDGQAAIRNARVLRPDVILMDVRMPGRKVSRRVRGSVR